MTTQHNTSRAFQTVSGNFRKAHEVLLARADKDGVFQTTEVAKALTEKLGLSRPSASSSVFQWSDPTGVRGYRKVRLYKARAAASDPPETGGVVTMIKTPKKGPTPPISANKNGPFYLAAGQWPKNGSRRYDEVMTQLRRLATEAGDELGYWALRKVVVEMADLGFHSFSVYRAVKEAVHRGEIRRDGAKRRFTSKSKSNGRRDPLSDPNSFKGPKTDKMIETERAPEGIQTGVERTSAGDMIRQAVQRKLETTEMQTLIDTYVKGEVEKSLRRQLGLTS